MSHTKQSLTNTVLTFCVLLLSARAFGQTQKAATAKAVIILLASATALAQDAQYKREEVTFKSGELQLKGTLFLPASAKPAPAVVLLHGSGETKRDECFYYAELFARHGIAALAYDKRGVGQSQGHPQAWRYFSFEALAADAAAAVSFLQNHKSLDARRVGLFGAGQGGTIAPLAASKNKDVAFIVQLSASVTTVGEGLLFARATRLRAEGFTEAELSEVRDMQLVDYDVTRGKRFDEFQTLWEKHKTKRWFRSVYLSDGRLKSDHPQRRWERTILDFDVVPILQKLEMPIFWLYGDPKFNKNLDVKTSLERVEALRRAGKQYETHSVAGADHNLELPGGRNDQPSWPRPLFDWLAKLLK
jgi:pimeloyl-ACP methyl ester carboxylesterase